MPEQTRFTFTVFTPTFNRASTLPDVKASLEAQTYRDFEWLIVDDGSIDGTDELVAGWIGSSTLSIRYIYQDNAGKHVAFNHGVREARGELFLSIDSDDECMPNALERLLYHWESIPPAEFDAFSGVTALCIDENGNVVGDTYPLDPYDSDSLHNYFSGVGRGEKFGFHRTDVLRRYPYPEPAGVKHIAPSVAWFAVGRHYRTRYVNETLRIYHGDVGGPRLSRLTKTTAQGRLIAHQDVITKYLDFMPSSPLLVIKSGVNYCRYSFHCGILPLQQVRAIGSVASKLLVLACLIPGAGAFARDAVRARLAGQA